MLTLRLTLAQLKDVALRVEPVEMHLTTPLPLGLYRVEHAARSLDDAAQFLDGWHEKGHLDRRRLPRNGWRSNVYTSCRVCTHANHREFEAFTSKRDKARLPFQQ